MEFNRCMQNGPSGLTSCTTQPTEFHPVTYPCIQPNNLCMIQINSWFTAMGDQNQTLNQITPTFIFCMQFHDPHQRPHFHKRLAPLSLEMPFWVPNLRPHFKGHPFGKSGPFKVSQPKMEGPKITRCSNFSVKVNGQELPFSRNATTHWKTPSLISQSNFREKEIILLYRAHFTSQN